MIRGCISVLCMGLMLSAGLATAADAENGRVLFGQLCASCHGPEGQGDGPAADALVLRPRPFAQAAFKFDTDADWEKGTDADIANVIRMGAAAYGGSPLMAPWPALSDAQIADLVAAVRSFGPEPQAGSVAAVHAAGPYTFDAVYTVLSEHCGDCHVQGAADGPWSLNTPPRPDRFPECLEVPAEAQARCATYHQLVDEPVPGIPAWIRPEEAAQSEPYLQACDPDGSFHIGHSLPAALPAADCAGFLGWIEAGAHR
jgi:mono/diheme cytochrome c family protein